MINIETGQIKFDDGFSLAPETTENDVTCPLGNDWTDREGNRWRWMSFPDSHLLLQPQVAFPSSSAGWCSRCPPGKNKKTNKPRRDNHYQPFSFDDFT